MDFEIKYHIGELYRYPGTRQKFKLIETNGMIFKFECGHWCTDNVFVDLIRVSTGIQVSNDIQKELF